MRFPIALAIAVALAPPARASPGDDRIVLADTDPELRHALVAALAPWKLEVVVDPATPDTDADAQQLAEKRTARFVAWRRDGDLILYDRGRAETDTREVRRGRLDPVDAAAVALTVKTLMRLPPPPEPAPARDDSIAVTATAPARDRELRLQSGLASRFREPGANVRWTIAALVAPWRDRGWSFGAMVDLGPSSDLDSPPFRGDFSDWSAQAVASWSHGERWRVEPFVSAGVARSRLRGSEMMVARDERSTMLVARAGAWLLRDSGWWSAGLSATLDGVLDPPTFRRTSASAQLFALPRYALALGLVIEIDVAW